MENKKSILQRVKGVTFRKIYLFILYLFKKITKNIKIHKIKKQLGDVGLGSYIDIPVNFYGNSKHIHIGNDTVIYGHFKFISVKGNFYVGDHTMSAQGLTVVTDNHVRNVGTLIKDVSDIERNTRFKDVIVEDDVWIGSNVTLLPGVTIGRGAFVGAGSVIRSSVPPYSVVVGNPQTIIGFNLSPSEIIEHEKLLYPENKRLSLNLLEENFSKYPQKIMCRGRKK